MRNNSAECVNSIMGGTVLEYQRTFSFMGVGFAANNGDGEQLGQIRP